MTTGAKRRGYQKESYVPVGRNACGKYAFHSRKAARRAAKRVPGDPMDAYRCIRCELWHMGHVPLAVKLGACTSDQWQALSEAERNLLRTTLIVNPDAWFGTDWKRETA